MLEFKKIETGFFPIYEFQLDVSLAEQCRKELENTPTVENNLNTTITNQPDLTKPSNYWNTEAMVLFNKAVNTVKNEIINPKLSMVITECWGNRTDKFQRHHPHIHRNSILSGIWYLTDSTEATTNFYYPNPWGFMNDFMPILSSETREIQKSIVPEVGKLIIFPSNLRHNTSPTLTPTPRFTIAFNAFVDGRIGDQRISLEFKTTELKEPK
jgi:uncharacterized protein (TIGR02466 family)